MSAFRLNCSPSQPRLHSRIHALRPTYDRPRLHCISKAVLRCCRYQRIMIPLRLHRQVRRNSLYKVERALMLISQLFTFDLCFVFVEHLSSFSF